MISTTTLYALDWMQNKAKAERIPPVCYAFVHFYLYLTD